MPEQPPVPGPEASPLGPEAADTRPRIISETSEEYLEFRRKGVIGRFLTTRVFGQGALGLLENLQEGERRQRAAAEQGGILAAPQEQDTRLAGISQQWEVGRIQAIRKEKYRLELLLQRPDFGKNVTAIFLEAMEDPELAEHFRTVIKDPIFPPAEEMATLFLRGEIPASLEDAMLRKAVFNAELPLREEYNRVALEHLGRTKAAVAARDGSLIDTLREEWRHIQEKYPRLIREAREQAERSFCEDMEAKESACREKYAGYEMPDHLFLRMLEVHIRKFENAVEGFKAEELALREEFKRKILADISAGKLPHLDPVTVERRMKETSVALRDPMLASEETQGDFDSHKAEVNLRSDVSPDDRTHTFVHEMSHALSGKIISSEMRGDRREIIIRKSGLRFLKTASTRNAVPDPSSRVHQGAHESIAGVKEVAKVLTWLDEAYTEYRAMEHLGLTDSQSYKGFRMLLDSMKLEGVDMDLLDAAYFENDDPALPPEKRKAAWKAFSDNLRQVYAGPEGEERLASTAVGVQMLLAVDRESTFSKQMDLLERKAV